jgi:hypothetical protein
MSTNMAEGIGFICNCDRWHCVAVRPDIAPPPKDGQALKAAMRGSRA